MSMYLYDNRLKSYSGKRMKWPYNLSDGYKATPETLSHAGFYFNPSKKSLDNVTCFLCHKSMEGWSPNDDPFEEHFAHFPECAWAVCRCAKRDNNDLPFSWDNEDQWPTSKRMEETRLKTFGNWWPHDRKKGWVGTSKKTAKAGFYFAPTYESEDNVVCMYCEVGLEGWEPKDDPMYEHRKRVPSCPFFAKPPPKSKKGNSSTASTANNKKSRRNKKIMQDGIEVVDLTPRTIKKNIRLNKNINVNVREIKNNNEKQVYNFEINEKINKSLHMININEEKINESSNIIIEERINESPNNLSISKERITESPNITSINEEVINEPPKIVSMNVDEPLNITSVGENRIDDSQNIFNINEEVIDGPPMIISMNMDEPLNITSIDENEIDESSNTININEEVIDESPRIISMDVKEPLTSIDENGNDEPSNNINITDESIDEPYNIIDINEKRIDELPNSINGIDERVEFIKKIEGIDGQIDKVESNEDEIDNLPNNTSINKKWIDEQVNNNSTDEEGINIFNVQTRIVEQVNNAQTNEEEIAGLINNDRTKGDESVEHVSNVKSNEGIDKLIKTREEIKEKSMNFSKNEEGINEKLNNVSNNEERNNILTCQEPNNIIMYEEELSDIIIDESNNAFFTTVEKRENVIINKEEQSNFIDEEGRNNIITNEEVRNSIIENEEKLNIIINKGPNNMITDEKKRNIIMDEEDKRERNIITDKEELNIIDEELNNIITDEGDIIGEQVNNVKLIEEIYIMDDIIKIEKTKGKLNNEEKLDEQPNIFGRNVERIEQLNNFTNEKRINELVENVEIKENNKKENLKTIPSETKPEKYEVNKSNDVESISIMSDNDPSKNKTEKIIQMSITSNVPIVSEGLKEIQPKSYFPYTPVSSIPQQFISTEPNRNVVNEVVPPAFITPTAFVKREAAFTVEEYLQNLKGTQNMRITERTNRKIESLIKNVNKSIETIMKIPLM